MRTTLVLASLGAVACGRVAVTSSNLVSSPKNFDSVADVLMGGIKASFDKVFRVGTEDIKVTAHFETDDFGALTSPDTFKEMSASGSHALDVVAPGWNAHSDAHPLTLAYSLSHKFKSGLTALKLTASSYGAAFKGAADSSGHVALESVSYGYGAKAAGTTLTVDNGFEFRGRWGADSMYKLSLGGWGVTTSVSQPFSPVMPDLKLSTSHEVAAGRCISSSVTLGPQSDGGLYSEAKLTYADKKIQDGATWEATASQPLSKLGGSKLTMKRSWSF